MSPILVRSLPFGLYLTLLVLEGLLPDWVLDFDVRWLYPLKVGLVALALAVLWRHYTELRCWSLSFVPCLSGCFPDLLGIVC